MATASKEKAAVAELPPLKGRIRYSMIADDDVMRALPVFTLTEYLGPRDRVGETIKEVTALRVPPSRIDELRGRLVGGNFAGQVEKGVRKIVEGLPEGGAVVVNTEHARLSLKHEKRHELLDRLRPELLGQLLEEVRRGEGYDAAVGMLKSMYQPGEYEREIICHGLEYMDMGDSARSLPKRIGQAYKFTDNAIAMCIETGLHKPSQTLRRLHEGDMRARA